MKYKEKTQKREIQRISQWNVHISTNNRGNGSKREGGNGGPVESLEGFPAIQKFALFGRKWNRRNVRRRFDVHFRPKCEEFDGIRRRGGAGAEDGAVAVACDEEELGAGLFGENFAFDVHFFQ